MSEVSNTVTRRGFLKTTAAAAGLSMLGTGTMTALAEDYRTGQVETSEEHLAHCVCRPNCFGFCNINVHVRDGKVVKTSRWEMPDDPEYSRICHRGLSHVDRIYGEGRLKYPLRRAEGTERGAGQWERISWDEAIADVCDHIKQYQAEFGGGSIIFESVSGNYGNISAAFYGRLQNFLGARNAQPCNDIAGGYAYNNMAGTGDVNELADMVNSKTIIAYGSNLTDSQVHHWHFVKEAKQAGVKLVVVDPVFNVLASKADRYISIRPGSDLALFLGLMNIIYNEGWMDEDFMRNRSVAPFFVREDDDKFLRDENGEFLVMENGELVPLSQAVKPELFAEVDVDGVHCVTTMKMQMELIEEWTPEATAEATTLSIDTIYELANYYREGRVTAIIGYGLFNGWNGKQTTAASFMVSCMTGNVGKPGCSSGTLYHGYYGWNYAFQYGAFSMAQDFATSDWVNIARGDLLNGEQVVQKMLIVSMSNVFHTSPNNNDYRDVIFPSIEYIVVVDSALTDTAMHADLVLPCAQHFEYEDVAGTACTYQICYNEKAIDPPYEAKSDADIVRLIAQGVGLGDQFAITDEEFLRDWVNTPDNIAIGASWDEVKEKKAVRFIGPKNWIPFQADAEGKNGFYTPSGRLEFYFENPTPLFGRVTTKNIMADPEAVKKEHMITRWEEPSENWYKNPRMQTYPFSFTSLRGRFRVHSQYFAVKMLNELDSEPKLYINPADAAAKGIEDGMYVEAFNDRGFGVGKAVISDGVRPGVVMYPKGWQASQHKAGSWGQLLNPAMDPWTTANLFPDCICDIRPWKEEN